ncbi:hypothetical protein ZWY2020_030231 [Hordeum vulgare]|nr:hypothetical protein ZWY2020_030231 [Hordeum vulgare]
MASPPIWWCILGRLSSTGSNLASASTSPPGFAFQLPHPALPVPSSPEEHLLGQPTSTILVSLTQSTSSAYLMLVTFSAFVPDHGGAVRGRRVVRRNHRHRGAQAHRPWLSWGCLVAIGWCGGVRSSLLPFRCGAVRRRLAWLTGRAKALLLQLVLPLRVSFPYHLKACFLVWIEQNIQLGPGLPA